MFTGKEDMEATALREQGWSISAITRHLGRSRETVRRHLDGKRTAGERALFWLRLYVEIVRLGFVTSRFPDHLFLSSSGSPLCPDWLCRKVRGYSLLPASTSTAATTCSATPSPP
jgi:hypothetical protein